MNPRQQLFEVLEHQAHIVQQMESDPRVPVTAKPVVSELAEACHDFDVQTQCLNLLKGYVGDLVSEYATTIIEADIMSMMLDEEK